MTFQITAQEGDSYADLAMRYTIGGSGYGPALAYQNNDAGGFAPKAGDVIIVPDSWINSAYLDKTGKPLSIEIIGAGLNSGAVKAKPAVASTNWVLVTAGILLLITLFTPLKKPVRRRIIK